MLSDLDSQLVRDLDVAAPEQRRSDMEAAIGLWNERGDLGNTEDYLRNLREDHRAEGLPPA